MMDAPSSAADFWEEHVYGFGKHLNRYPFDTVVSFVYRNLPPNKPRSQVRLLEVGCGAGNNLWFAAREGLQVAGIDGSASAIASARRRFEEDGLRGDLRVGDFRQLPFPDGWADLAVDRAAITCCGRTDAKQAVGEVRRVLTLGGRFLFNPYASTHSSARTGRPGPEGVTVDISGGSVAGVGKLRFYGPAEIDDLFAEGWTILSRQHLEITDHCAKEHPVHAEWRVVAEKR